MSYEIATDQLIAVVEGLTPSTTLATVGSRFRHDPTGRLSQPRSFTLRAGPQGAVLRNTRETFERVDVDLTIAYQPHTDERALDVLIQSDRSQVSRALLDSDNWNQPTSKIVDTAADSDELMLGDLSFEPADDEAGARWLLTLRFPLVHL